MKALVSLKLLRADPLKCAFLLSLWFVLILILVLFLIFILVLILVFVLRLLEVISNPQYSTETKIERTESPVVRRFFDDFLVRFLSDFTDEIELSVASLASSWLRFFLDFFLRLTTGSSGVTSTVAVDVVMDCSDSSIFVDESGLWTCSFGGTLMLSSSLCKCVKFRLVT